jgi:hypothetical protein
MDHAPDIEQVAGFNNSSAKLEYRRVGRYHNGTVLEYGDCYSWSLNRRGVSLIRGTAPTEVEAWAAIRAAMFHVKQY